MRIDAAENPSMISDGYGHIEAQVGIWLPQWQVDKASHRNNIMIGSHHPKNFHIKNWSQKKDNITSPFVIWKNWSWTSWKYMQEVENFLICNMKRIYPELVENIRKKWRTFPFVIWTNWSWTSWKHMQEVIMQYYPIT